MIQVKTVTKFLFIVFAIFFTSCNKDDTAPAKSREVKFDISGTFSGTLNVTYITASGGATNESIPALPWTKSITYQSTVSGTTITIGGAGGIAGQTLKVKVFAGGSLVSETPGVATSAGVIVIASPTYIF